MALHVIAQQVYKKNAYVFSFGILLWKIAHGETPYRNIIGLQVTLDVLNNDFRLTIPKKTPVIFTLLTKRCWDRDLEKRASFKEIIKDEIPVRSVIIQICDLLMQINLNLNNIVFIITNLIFSIKMTPGLNICQIKVNKFQDIMVAHVMLCYVLRCLLIIQLRRQCNLIYTTHNLNQLERM